MILFSAKPETKFENLQGKLFKLRVKKNQFLPPDTISQIKCYIENCPPNQFSSIVVPNIFIDSEIVGGILKRIKSPNCQYFEFKTLDRPVQSTQSEIVGGILFLDNEKKGFDEKIFEETIDFDSTQFFEYINSDLPSPIENPKIQAINLYDGGKATVRQGFQIKTEDQKKDKRPIKEQLNIENNLILNI